MEENANLGNSSSPVTEERKKSGRRRRLAILGLLLLFFFASLGSGLYYWKTKMLPVRPTLLTEVAGLARPRYLFSIEGLDEPIGVAVSPGADRIFVTEAGYERKISIFSRDGSYINTFSAPNADSGLTSPTFVMVGNDGRVYVSDTGRHEVQVYTQDGEFISTIKPSGETIRDFVPAGLAMDGAGRLYVSDINKGTKQEIELAAAKGTISVGSHRVLVFDAEGNLAQKMGSRGRGKGLFAFPNGLAVDGEGRIYVADSENHRIQVFNQDRQVIAVVLAGAGNQMLGLPYGLALDAGGRLHVSDPLDHTIQVFGWQDGKLKFEYSYGTAGPDPGKFLYPAGIAIDRTGRIYIADKVNKRVQVWAF